MLIGRISGWLMVLFGIGLLLRYYTESTTTAHLLPQFVSDLWGTGDALMVHSAENSLLAKFSAVMASGWAGAVLFLFGIVLIWGCHQPRKPQPHRR